MGFLGLRKITLKLINLQLHETFWKLARLRREVRQTCRGRDYPSILWEFFILKLKHLISGIFLDSKHKCVISISAIHSKSCSQQNKNHAPKQISSVFGIFTLSPEKFQRKISQ